MDPFWQLTLMVSAAVLGLLCAWILTRGSRRKEEHDTVDVTPSATDLLGGQSFELKNLKHRAADHTTADAIVRVPGDYNPNAPIHLVVYNHGFYTDIQGAYADANLANQMAGAPPNSVLFLPEWQKRPGAASGDQGRFSEQGMFAGMVQDAFDSIDVLRGKTLNDVSTITILGHSAGYGPNETELYKNGIGNKVVNLTLLDALYDHDGFNPWLQDNIGALARGNKRFYNFFWGTAKYSKDQAAFVKKLLASAGLDSSLVVEDYDSGDKVMSTTDVTRHSIIFKYSSATIDGLEPHFAIPNLYVGASVSADNRNA